MLFRFIFIIVLLPLAVNAQVSSSNFIKDLIESLAENLPDDFDLSELEEQLNFFNKHPINLNHTTQQELKNLIFLSPLQITNLFNHIKANGKLIDVLELQGIPTFDLETIQNMMPFVTIKTSDLVDRVTARKLLTLGENDLVMRLGRTLENQKGFTGLSGSRYLGTKERFLFRYKYSFSNRLGAAIIFEKDAGESFINGAKRFLFDFQSAHIAIYNTGKFKKIIVGDYTLQFGQGLNLWSGFSFGKAPDVASIAKKELGLKAYGSANEYSFFRGFATTYSISEKLDLTPFFSTKNIDASLDLTPQNEEVLSTVTQTGLHRTVNEIRNKNSVHQHVYGIAAQFHHHGLNIGGFAHRSEFSKAFVTGAQVYNAFNFTGKHLVNVGMSYDYTFKNAYCFGELGKSSTGGIAYLNGILVSLSPKVSTVLLHRNYRRDYHNFYIQAIAEGTDGKNETGFYAGINVNPKKAWTLSFYADYFKFPWLKFRIDAPSNGYELLSQATYTPSKTLKSVFRYKYERRQQNTNLIVPINFIDEVKKESFRVDVNWQLNTFLKLQNRIECTQFRKGSSEPELGYLIYQDIQYSSVFSRLSGNIRIGYFNTPSYDTRIYAYEDDVLYNFSFGMYNGKGYRTIFNLKYKVFKKFDVWARYAMSLYPKYEKVGSGLDEIKGNKKTDLKLQFRYQF
jgi:hypothetical protein